MGVGVARIERDASGDPVIVVTDSDGNEARFPWCYYGALAEDVLATARLLHGLARDTRSVEDERARTSIG